MKRNNPIPLYTALPGLLILLIICFATGVSGEDQVQNTSINSTGALIANNTTLLAGENMTAMSGYGNDTWILQAARSVYGNDTLIQVDLPKESALNQTMLNESAGIEYVTDAMPVRASPDGNAFAGQYAQGAFGVEIGASITEGRGNSLNESSTLTLKDSTEVDGYVKTLMKTFTYESGTNL